MKKLYCKQCGKQEAWVNACIEFGHCSENLKTDADCKMCEQYRNNKANYCPHCLKKFNYQEDKK